MKKSFKITAAVLGAVMVSSMLAGCSNLVKDPNPYRFENKPYPTAETDADMTIDGKFEETRWQNVRWLNGVDKPNSRQHADIEFTTSYGEKGVYFAMKVEEHGTNIWVNPNRASWLNSCIEMYMGPGEDGDGSPRLFEFDFMADGAYSSKLNYNGWNGAATTHDKMPVVASQTLGGKVNTPECYGYTVEAFFPWAFLEFAGYDVSEPENMVIGVAPVHIFSFNYNGTDKDADRFWSQWPREYLPNFNMWNPSTFFKFGKEGLICHKIIVNQTGTGRGTVAEKSGLDYVLSGVDTTFSIKTVNGASVKKLLVNGEDYLPKLTQNGGEYRFTVVKPSQDVVIDVELG